VEPASTAEPGVNELVRANGWALAANPEQRLIATVLQSGDAWATGITHVAGGDYPLVCIVARLVVLW
jgi:hypothetical protein